MAAALLMKSVLPVSALCYAERFVVNNHPEMLGGLASVFYGPVLKAYGLVIGVNIVASGFVLIALASKVGQARKKYDFQLPRLYNPEDTDEAKKFNCVQRGHQQALETYTQFVATSLVGGIRNPITTAFFGVVWCVSRLKWAEGYATGDPAARYSHSFWGRHIWTGLLGVLGTSVSTMIGIFMA